MQKKKPEISLDRVEAKTYFDILNRLGVTQQSE